MVPIYVISKTIRKTTVISKNESINNGFEYHGKLLTFFLAVSTK